MITKILRYWYTLRFLKAKQIFWHIYYHLIKPQIKLRRPPERNTTLSNWVSSVPRKQSLIGPENFVFFGETGSLKLDGWDNPSKDLLWRFNQHYFGDLNAHRSFSRRNWHHSLIDNWINDNPAGIRTGWHAYPTSLRVVNWVKWLLSGVRVSQNEVMLRKGTWHPEFGKSVLNYHLVIPINEGYGKLEISWS